MDEKRPLDLALDVFVYVPVGLAVSAKELLPQLAQRGRARLENRVATARVVGQFAVQQARQRYGPGSAPPPAASRQPPPPPPAHRPTTSGPDAADLAIPGYDSLAASQVLPRLEGLAPAELEAVRAYEAEHRGRKTILGRIDQLQAP